MEYPKEGEVFELTLDGKKLASQPGGLVQAAGLCPEAWAYFGPEVDPEMRTRSFQLVPLGIQPRLDVVKMQLLRLHDELPKAPWLLAFKEKFLEPKPKHPLAHCVAVTDDAFLGPSQVPHYLHLGRDGSLHVGWSGEDFDDGWLWLAFANKAK